MLEEEFLYWVVGIEIGFAPHLMELSPIELIPWEYSRDKKRKRKKKNPLL